MSPQQASSLTLGHALSSQQLDEIRAAFDLFDTTGTGKVNAADIQQCLLSLGLDHKTPALFTMLTDLEESVTHKKSLSFEEFAELVTGSYRGGSSYAELFKVFQLFDPDKTGLISASSLEAVAKEIGENFSKDDINEMIRLADTNRDGFVTMDEFYRIMTQRPLD